MQGSLSTLHPAQHVIPAQQRHMHMPVKCIRLIQTTQPRFVGRVKVTAGSADEAGQRPHRRRAHQRCCSSEDRKKSLQIQPSLTHEHSSHAVTAPSSASQQERLLALEGTSAELEEDHHEHEAPLNGSTVHKALAWVLSRVGLLQLASQLRGKAWNAIAISCLMAIALLTAWAGGLQIVQAQLCNQISVAATASIYFLAGIPELVDLCFDLTAGHIDTHVLMTLAVIGTLAIGGALEVIHGQSPLHCTHVHLAVYAILHIQITHGYCIPGQQLWAFVPALMDGMQYMRPAEPTANLGAVHSAHLHKTSGQILTAVHAQGALLMVLFEGSHVLEHKLTDQAQGNLQALFDATPEHAVLVELNADKSPDMSKLRNAKAKDVAVGSNMLVRPGQQVQIHSPIRFCTSYLRTLSSMQTHVSIMLLAFPPHTGRARNRA